MNQRTLKVLYLSTGGGHMLTNAALVPGLIVDINQDNVTTNAWTYANIGRREMKVFGWVGPAHTGGQLSTYNAWVQSATTGAFTGTLTTECGPIVATTYGPTSELHFATNNRYIRVLHNSAGASSSTPIVMLLVEQRAS